MNNLITIILFSLTSAFSATATTTPEVIISTESIEVSSDIKTDIFKSAEFDAVKENLKFMTTTDVSMIKIYSEDGNLEFQLPVMSQDVKINKNLFGQGNYMLGFMIKGQSQEVFTKVTIK